MDERERDARTGSPAAAVRMQHQARWVDLQIQQAMERGDFDDLPGAQLDAELDRETADQAVQRWRERRRATGRGGRSRRTSP